ncbi:MAG: acyltransferase family protein [Beijerinckiaceae bacterium]
MADGALHTDENRENNFGFLRLIFATLVIVSHSPELVDGNRSREILTQIFGTMSFGEAAVDGFFLVSGYLITKSYIQSQSTASYLIKRVLRIVPGYLVSFWICVLVVAPFVGAEKTVLSAQNFEHQFLLVFLLSAPDVPGSFHGLPYAALNGSMWTIAYEFRCYLAAAVLGLLGVYTPRYRRFLLVAVIAFLILNAAGAMHEIHLPGSSLVGSPEISIRFAAVFGVGAVYYVFRDKIRLTSFGAVIAATVLVVMLFNHYAAEATFAVLGGYLIFWFAFKVPVFRASRFDNNADISYGLYLYAWPIQSLIIWSDRAVNPWLLCCMSVIGAGILGYASWRLIEKPALHLILRRPSMMPQLQGYHLK